MNAFSVMARLYLYMVFPLLLSCHDRTSTNTSDLPADMKATIMNKVFYEDIPSASGLEVVGDSTYVIGDDSPYLYQLNPDFTQASKLALTDTAGFDSGRVAKSEKMDLESIAAYEKDGKSFLLILGSGASDARMKAFMVEVDASSGKIGDVHAHSLNKLYEQLQQEEQVVRKGQLNVEGLAIEGDKLYLMHRAVGQEPNVLLVYELNNFLNALEHDDALPNPNIHHFNLKDIENFQAGFSGADMFDGKLFYTASVEQTEDAISDGEVLGSYIGVINLNDLENDTKQPIKPKSALLVHADGSSYTGKAESLVVSAGEGDGNYKVLVVSDDDKGHSELLEVELAVK